MTLGRRKSVGAEHDGKSQGLLPKGVDPIHDQDRKEDQVGKK
jgi:hypothetical protein